MFGASEHWTGRFLKKNLSHVQVVALLPQNKWVTLDPSPSGMNVGSSIYNQETIDMMRKFDNMRILKVTTHHTKNYFARMGVMTCVDVVQYILGLHFKWCFTPYQLYKKLLRCENSYISVKVIR